MKEKNKAPEKEWLIQKYIVENLTIYAVAELANCSTSTISRYMRKYKIPKKNYTDSIKNTKKTNLKKYGFENVSKVKEVRDKVKKTNLKKYGAECSLLNEEVKEKIKKTNLEKYGVEYSCLNEEVKEKIKKTNLEKYGNACSLHGEEIKEKTKNTNLKKYGNKSHLKNEDIKNKINKTNLKRYGTISPIQNKDILKKREFTYLEKYGVKSPLQNKEIMEKFKKTNIEKYGYEFSMQNPEIREKTKNSTFEKYGVYNVSQSEIIKNKIKESSIKSGKFTLIFGESIPKWNLIYNLPQMYLYKWKENNENTSYEEFIAHIQNYKRKLSDIENIFSLKFNIEKYDKTFNENIKYKPDFKFNNNFAVNTDGLYWHSELHVNNDYHFNMRRQFEHNNCRIFQFRANEIFHKLHIIQSIINNSLGKTSIKIGARKTRIAEISSKDAETFLIQNHMKGYKAAKHLGLYFNNELISVMSYKTQTSSNYKFIKIERFCSKINTNVMGGFNKLLKQVALELPNLPIHYWVDLRYGTGNFLLNHGFKLEKETLGWEWTDSFETYNRLKCRANMDERGLSEKEYAAELKWVKIYDAGQRLYIRE